MESSDLKSVRVPPVASRHPLGWKHHAAAFFSTGHNSPKANRANRWLNLGVSLAATGLLFAAAYRPVPPRDELPALIPCAAPFLQSEMRELAPPFETTWKEKHGPGKCGTCHSRIFEQWNGSMMSNSWRDPAWRAAFLLAARMTSAAGECDTPQPPDGTRRAALNPFANADCTSTFELGHGRHTTARPGSLLDGFCAQCHMPTNYTDNVSLAGLGKAPETGVEDDRLDPRFNPTSDAGTGLAFATVEAQMRNTATGRQGIFCAVCHSIGATREMPFGNVQGAGTTPVVEAGGDRRAVPDPRSPSLGWDVGAGSYRLSPHALATSEFRGPLAAGTAGRPEGEIDPYLSGVFGRQIPVQRGVWSGHRGVYQALHERAELCGACHDVTNPLPIRNQLGQWVGGFPIERTYSEWRTSRYADRPGNANFDPRFKRDCQTCHMQQDYGAPGTAQALYQDGHPIAPLAGKPSDDGPSRPVLFSHHFIGGNTYVTRLAGADVDAGGANQPYPQLSTFSFTSDDPKSPYHYAYWTETENRGAQTQHARLAWDRLRNVVDLDLAGPAVAPAGVRAPLRIAVTNSGSGHDFPSGFPEGRTAWVAVRAFDLASGAELAIYDSKWRRASRGVGYLTREDSPDPGLPGCKDWELPAGSPDPYAVQFKAVATLGDGCPTLALPYATPLNLVRNRAGLPIDAAGKVIDRDNPRGVPQWQDLDGDGDLYDDAFLSDSRLRPLPNAGARETIDRYSVVIPAGTQGPVAVVAAVYYQSLEAIVARKFLGNLADLDTDFRLEPCVLGGACDGRKPTVEPAVVEGAPPVPMEVRNWVIDVRGGAVDRTPPAARTYPAEGARHVYRDLVVKAVFSEPVQGVTAKTFTLTDAGGQPVPAFVDQIGDGTWGLFPHAVFLTPGATYTAHLAAGICDAHGNCTPRETVWRFTVAAAGEAAEGDTAIPLGFGGPASRR